jgi:pantoate kinase
MKVKAFCPGHISCIFAPCHHPGPLATGSKGLGIVMGLGSEAYVAKRDDDIVKVTINGIESDAPVTKHAITSLAPGKGFDVFIRCPLPQGQGFGTSASGTLATAMCVASIMGMDDSLAVKSAHTAENVCGGGLGDVSGLLPGTAVTARIREGVPPFGESVPVDIELKRLTVAVLGPPIST